MEKVIALAIGAGAAYTGFLLVNLIKRTRRKIKTSGWKVGDMIIPYQRGSTPSFWKRFEESKSSYVQLDGWDPESVYLSIGKTVFKEDYESVKHNKSDVWRKNYERAKKFMGANPAFSPTVEPDIVAGEVGEKDTIDGEPIETMNETLCQIYLNQALEEEDFDLAEKLRKRLERFR